MEHKEANSQGVRVLIYTRVSTVGQAEGYSLETQREACEKKARQVGATEIRHLQDTFTGTSLERPAMEQLRMLVKQRAVDKIIVYDPDRFSRDLNDLLIVTKEVDRAGIELIFVNFDWQNTPQGMLFLQMRGAIAQFEHAMIKERTQRGKRKKAAKGKLRTWAKPFGYRYDKENSTLVLDPVQAPIVEAMYRWALEGMSCVEIAKRLAGKGIPGPTGRGWDYTTVLRILRRSTYHGVMTRKDEQPDWEPIQVPAVVSKDIWDEVQTKIRRGKRFHQRHPKREYLLRTLLRCEYCGGPLSVNLQTHKAKDLEYSYYRCMRHKRRKFGADAPKLCPLKDVRTQALDDAVWHRIREFLLQPEACLPYLEAETRNSVELARERLAEAKGRHEKLQSQLKRANNLYLNGAYDPNDDDRNQSEYQKVLLRLKDDLLVVQDEIQTYSRVLAQAASAENTAAIAKRWAAAWPQTVNAVPFVTRLEVVRRLVQHITVGNEKVIVHGHFVLDATSDDSGQSPGVVHVNAEMGALRKKGGPQAVPGTVRGRPAGLDRDEISSQIWPSRMTHTSSRK